MPQDAPPNTGRRSWAHVVVVVVVVVGVVVFIVPEDQISSDEEAWLTELTTAHRTAVVSTEAVASTGPVIPLVASTTSRDGEETSDEEAWLQDLTTAHRPVVTSTDVAVSAGPVIAAVASTDLAVASIGLAVASTRPAVARTILSAASTGTSMAMRPRGVIQCGPRSRTWDEFVLFSQSLGHLPAGITIPDRHCVLWQLPLDELEFSTFMYAYRRLAAWYLALGPIIFKVGIAADPGHRFWNREFGYDTEKEWHFMEVQCRGPANQMRDLEISLIAGLGGLPGCRNQAAGGDGVRPDRVHTTFQYMVIAPCGPGIGLHRAWSILRHKFPRVA